MDSTNTPVRRRRSEKGARTRERIFQSALARFRHAGFAETSLRSIAADAGVTPALCYRYFDSKDALVAELYGRLLDEWHERAQALPRGTWIQRALWLTRLAIEVLEPYRTLLRALLPPMLEGHPTASPLHNPASRRRGEPMFLRAVAEADDAPSDPRALGDAAFLAQLALLFFWAVDRSRGQRATHALLGALEAGAPVLRLALRTPLVGARILSLGASVRLGLAGEPTDPEAPAVEAPAS